MINRIYKNIFIGDAEIAKNENILFNLGINNVISIGTCEEINEYIFHKGISYLKIEIADDLISDISKFFSKTNLFLEKNSHNNILIHCKMGISRSATIILAYLIYLGWSFENSLELLKSKKPEIKPNDFFIEQLKKYEKNHLI